MSFIIQQIEGSKVVLKEHKRPTLRIGRGTDAHLRSENSVVALEHAMIETSQAGYDLVDRGSITGTYLNGRTIESARLGKGDEIGIGDLRITVQAAEPGRPLFLRVETSDDDLAGVEDVPVPVGTVSLPKAAPGGTLKAPRVDYVASYRLKRGILSKSTMVWLALAVALTTLALVTVGKQQVAYRPGRLSVSHTQAAIDGERLIGESNCTACHEPWGGATDAKCMACHKQAGHQEGLAQLGSCTACHTEHRQLANLGVVYYKECIACHRDLQPDPGKTLHVAKTINAFEKDHPEFKLTIVKGGKEVKVSLSDPKGRLSDQNRFKFNHQCHLIGNCNKRPPTIENPVQEVEKLTCDSCHKVQGDTGIIDNRSYDKYCSRCHPLTFDNRFPPVPHHLNLETVAGYIANAYSGNQNILKMDAEEVSRLFAQGTATQINVGSEIVRSAQRTVQARCKVCHDFQPNGEAVRPPTKSNRWFKGERVFDHGKHLNESVKTKCVDCHEGVIESKKTIDVNMPGIKACTGCHKAANEYRDKGIETCQTCHPYHSLTVKQGAGWTLKASVIPAEMKLAALGGKSSSGSPTTPVRRRNSMPLWVAFTAPLAVVVLFGMVAAIIGAIRARVAAPVPSPSSAANKGAAPVPTKSMARRPAMLPTPMPADPNAQLTPAPAKPTPMPAPKPKPTPAPAAPPVLPERTVTLDISDIKDEIPVAPSSATVATDWFGMIVFTGGKLSGQSFTIDPEKGLYIGRDRELASVVIEDSRISRRHCWVGVKDGKVVVVDQKSTNGTFLGDAKQRVTEAELKDGLVVILGENAAAFRYQP
ncbi:MAG: FHA domain-containing protein [Thermoanaerobaculia bacterium]|jgi:pSer/pThr/pTyr-binding forkhead associated (FHA) protein